MNISQLTRIIFRDSHSYKTVNDKDKSGMFFILNRIMARKHPLNANTLNYNGIDTASATDVWFETLSPRYRDVPKEFNVPWGKLKKKGESSVLKGFSDKDKQILALYPELIEEAQNEADEQKLIEKEGTIKVTKKRGRVAKKK
jgi:hypothetical protein